MGSLRVSEERVTVAEKEERKSQQRHDVGAHTHALSDCMLSHGMTRDGDGAVLRHFANAFRQKM